jgi:hypothetical protein
MHGCNTVRVCVGALHGIAFVLVATCDLWLTIVLSSYDGSTSFIVSLVLMFATAAAHINLFMEYLYAQSMSGNVTIVSDIYFFPFT